MKKLLILILIALLLALAFIIAINGVSMGKFEILALLLVPNDIFVL